MTENKTPVTGADLANFDDTFVEADVTEDAFEPVPDGKYQVFVDQVELVRTMKGDPMLKWALKIIGPTNQGRILWRNNVLGRPENVKWAKKDLYTCGLKLERLSELPANLSRLLDVRLEVTKKTRRGDDGRDFDSVYLNKRIETDGQNGGGATNNDEALKRF